MSEKENTQERQEKIAAITKALRSKDVESLSMKELAFLHKYDVLTQEEIAHLKELKAEKAFQQQANEASINRGVSRGMLADQSELTDSHKKQSGKIEILSTDSKEVAKQKHLANHTTSMIRDALHQPAFVIALIVLLLIILFMRSYLIPSGSMNPTLLEGDRIMSTAIYFPSEDSVEIGDIVCFYPPHKHEVYVKRVIAKEGDRVQIVGSTIYVNGEVSPYGNSGGVISTLDVIVSPGCLWMAGDNGAVSEDSRFWGELPVDNLISKVHAIYWPINRAKWFG